MSSKLSGFVSLLALPLACLLLAGCSETKLAMETSGTTGIWGVSLPKSTFPDKSLIPNKYTMSSSNISPPLEWRPLVDHIVEYVVIVEDKNGKDKDGNTGATLNWAVYGIPASVTSLPEGASSTTKFHQARNNQGVIGYTGPNPSIDSDKQHQYFFQVFALYQPLGLDTNGVDRATLLAAMNGKVVAVSFLTGLYPEIKK